MLKPLRRTNENDTEKDEKNKFNSEWLRSYSDDFKKRFLQLLSYEFKDVDVQLSLGVVDPTFVTNDKDTRLSNELYSTFHETDDVDESREHMSSMLPINTKVRLLFIFILNGLTKVLSIRNNWKALSMCTI